MDVGRDLAELVDQAVDIGELRLTRVQVAEKAGVDPETAHRFWRAAGFPEVGDDVVMFSDADVRTLEGVKKLLETEQIDIDTALEVTRAIGQTASRLAAAEIAVLRERVSRPPVTEEGIDPEGAEESLQLARSALPFLEDALVYLWRRHLSANAKRALVMATVDQPVRSVGFVDMTRFSVASQTLSAEELTRMINRFETAAFDTVAEFGGRVVKLIGDEVLFATDEPTAAANIALELVHRIEEDPDVPRVRAGLSHGPVVEIQGDVFGETVNLASRLTEAAKSGSVIVSESFRDALDGSDDLDDPSDQENHDAEGRRPGEGLRTTPCGRRRVRGSGGSVEAIAEVAQPRNDVGVRVQFSIDRRREDVDVGMLPLQRLDSFRCRNDRDHADPGGSGALHLLQRGPRGATGRQHRVQHESAGVLEPRQLGVVLGGLEGRLVPLQPEVPDPDLGEQVDHGVQHPQPRPQDRDRHHRLSELPALGLLQGGLDRRFLGRQVLGGLQHQDRGEALGQRPEDRRLGPLVAQGEEKVAGQRVIYDLDAHGGAGYRPPDC